MILKQEDIKNRLVITAVNGNVFYTCENKKVYLYEVGTLFVPYNTSLKQIFSPESKLFCKVLSIEKCGYGHILTCEVLNEYKIENV